MRVAWQSVPHGFPPIVARAGLPAAEREALAAALLEMPKSASGVALLQRLNIDGFERGTAGQFDSIRALVREQDRHAT